MWTKRERQMLGGQVESLTRLLASRQDLNTCISQMTSDRMSWLTHAQHRHMSEPHLWTSRASGQALLFAALTAWLCFHLARFLPSFLMVTDTLRIVLPRRGMRAKTPAPRGLCTFPCRHSPQRGMCTCSWCCSRSWDCIKQDHVLTIHPEIALHHVWQVPQALLSHARVWGCSLWGLQVLWLFLKWYFISVTIRSPGLPEDWVPTFTAAVTITELLSDRRQMPGSSSGSFRRHHMLRFEKF